MNQFIRIAFFFLLIFIPIISFSQITILLKPDAAAGKDAKIWSNNPNNNYATDGDFIAAEWTWNGDEGTLRSLIQFDLSSIPFGSIITNAYLTLFYNPTSASAGQAGLNASLLQRITSSWDENVVTWNNQPSFTTSNEVTLAQSTLPDQDYPDVDVTQLVQDMIDNPSSSFGFLLRLQTEQTYSSMKFASSDYTDYNLVPELEITYVHDKGGGNDSCFVSQPNSVDGKDAKIWDLEPTLNYGNDADFIAASWTWNGEQGTLRSLLDFDLTTIPSNAIINSAYLSLYYNPTSASAGQAGSNASWLQRIISTWDEASVTWSNQPQITTQHEVLLPASVSVDENYFDVDVKEIVTDMVNDPLNSFGFMFQLEVEQTYASMKFASSDHLDSGIHPKLEICYSIPTTILNLFENDLAGLYLFPNPATDFITIEFDQQPEPNSLIQILSAEGRCIDQFILEKSTNKFELQLNKSKYNSGIYFISVNTNSNILKGKFVVK